MRGGVLKYSLDAGDDLFLEPPRERGSIEMIKERCQIIIDSEPPRERGSIEIFSFLFSQVLLLSPLVRGGVLK